MILENHGWMCLCGESFDEPEQMTGHQGRHRGTAKSSHKPLGYCDLDTREQALSWNFSIFKGQWKEQLDKKHAAGELPFVVTEDGLGASDELSAESPEAGTNEDVAEGEYDTEDGATQAETDEVEPDAEVPLKKGQRRPIDGMVKLAFRPKVFDVDESLIHLYNLFLGSVRRVGIPYEPSFGDWLRDAVFQHYFEHPEIIDLSSILTPTEKAAMIALREEQHAVQT